MSSSSVIALFSLFIFHFLFASSIEHAIEIDASGVSSTYNLSRNKEAIDSRESRNLFQINDGVFVTKENTSKSDDVNVPKFAEKENVDPLLQQYLADSTGYYTVQQYTGGRMFYVFVESENLIVDPIVLWLNGGPGSSTNIGLFYENGPFRFDHGPSLLQATNGWNRMSNIIYVDQPIGTGFSYAKNNHEIRHTLDDVTDDLYNFLQEFFKDKRHDSYKNNKFFIAGESYAGHYAPALALKILEEKNAGRGIPINLIGVAIGNALTDLGIQYETLPYFALKYNIITITEKEEIEKIVPACKACVDGCGRGNEVLCRNAFINCKEVLHRIRMASRENLYNIDGPTYDFSKMEALLNKHEVKSLLKVPTNRLFTSHNDRVFDALKPDWGKSSQGTVSAILRHGFKVLTYAGELDLQFNHLGTMMCARALQWSGQQGFNDIKEGIPFMVDNEEEGLRFTYEHLTYIKVAKAGQMVPLDRPRTAFVMMHRWMRGTF